MNKPRFSSLLIKFGEKKSYLEDFLNKGYMHCNTMQYFATLEDKNNKKIGDPYENVFEINNFKDALVDIKFVNKENQKIKLKGKVQLRRHFNKTDPCGNLFCTYLYDLSTLKPDEIKPISISKEEQIQKWCVVIFDVDEFISRVNEKSIALGIHCENRAVVYKDFKEHNGPRNPFLKDDSFSHQKEYRFYFNNPDFGLFPLEIKPINDIAILIKSDELNTYNVKGIL